MVRPRKERAKRYKAYILTYEEAQDGIPEIPESTLRSQRKRLRKDSSSGSSSNNDEHHETLSNNDEEHHGANETLATNDSRCFDLPINEVRLNLVTH